MRISFKRSGGFAGLPSQHQSVELDTEKLPAEKAQELQQLVEGARPFDQLSQPESASKARDAYQYDLTIEHEGRTHSIRATDGAVPKQLQPLIRWLGKEVNESLRKRKS
jgi:hypothetical protein